MIDAKDITKQIESDFGEKAELVNQILATAISKTDYLNSNRILRCILFLADKDMDKLYRSIETAIYDPRDVMLRAEYTT